ncbi:MAG: ribosome maturation factor RimP [Alphaproteobacteria bacterium]|nr:ribosome maturation factor RimP [Alphaproteobacteria bacterium]MDE1969256.1 ribosome maturation factor RimP [Alphaproteobacteria bacterium]
MDAKGIEALIVPSLEAMGYRIVRAVFTGGRRATLQVMAERADDAAMSVDDCSLVSQTVSALLDVADPIAESYQLEVSSPGIDRPLFRPEDYERFAGFEAKLELHQPLDGRRRFRGRLLGLDGDAVKVNLGAEIVRLPFAGIARAKLVLTDELIAATRPKARSEAI